MTIRTKMMAAILWVSMAPLCLAHCGEEEPVEDDEEQASGCTKDSDCSAGRICELGECVADNNTTGSGGSTATGAELTLENYSSYAVWYFFASPCGSTSWGDDLLGDNVIPAGYSATLEDIPPGCWDFLAVAEQEVAYWDSYGNQLGAGQLYTWTLGD